MKCKVCGESFYRQTQLDPPEHCWCGEDWDWGRLPLNLQIKRLRIRLSELMRLVLLPKDMQG